MFKYDRTEFLELFDSEHIIDAEVNIAKYKVTKNNDYVLTIYLSPYDGKIGLTLANKKLDFLIFEIGLSDIGEIKIDKKIPEEARLVIYKEGQKESTLTIMINPGISLHSRI